MATIKGKAVIWGVQGITVTAAAVNITGTGEIQGADFNRTSDKVDVSNTAGDCVSQIFFNLKKTLTLTVIPSHASVAATAAIAGGTWLPAPGTLVAIADTGGDGTGTIMDVSYNVISSKQGRTNTGIATCTLELEQFEANDVTTSTT